MLVKRGNTKLLESMLYRDMRVALKEISAYTSRRMLALLGVGKTRSPEILVCPLTDTRRDRVAFEEEVRR